jgi:hypothetical protein
MKGLKKRRKKVNNSVLFPSILPLFYIYFRSGRLHFVRKSQNRCTLVNIRTYTVHCTLLYNNDYLCCRLFSNDNPGEPILYTVLILYVQ